MKVLLVNDSTSNPNWGDRAAALGLKHMIAVVGGTLAGVVTEDELREARFGPALPAPAASESRFERVSRLLLPPLVSKVADRASRRFRAPVASVLPVDADDLDRAAASLVAGRERFAPVLDLIRTADAVVVHGDGAMVGFGTIPRAQLLLAYVAKKHFGKRVALVNHTADFDDERLLSLATRVYPLLDDIVYRDPISAERWGGVLGGRHAPDSAFVFAPAEPAEWRAVVRRAHYFDVWPDQASFDPAAPYVCVGGSSRFSYDGVPSRLIEAFGALVAHLRASYDGQIVLTVSDIVDEPVFRAVARSLRLPLIGLRTPVQQAVDILGHADAYVGGRWHPAIFSLRAGVPVVPLVSKTFKIQGLLQSAGIDARPVEPLEVGERRDEIAGQLRRCVDEEADVRRRRRAWGDAQARDAWDNVRLVSGSSETREVAL